MPHLKRTSAPEHARWRESGNAHEAKCDEDGEELRAEDELPVSQRRGRATHPPAAPHDDDSRPQGERERGYACYGADRGRQEVSMKGR
jgi:hypothetical protein